MARWFVLGLLLIWIGVLAAVAPSPVPGSPDRTPPDDSFHPDVNEPPECSFTTLELVELLEEIETLPKEEQAVRVAEYREIWTGLCGEECLDYLLSLGTVAMPQLLDIIYGDLWVDPQSSLLLRVLDHCQDLGAEAVGALARIHDEERFWS
jgi:hypothetical protein